MARNAVTPTLSEVHKNILLAITKRTNDSLQYVFRLSETRIQLTEGETKSVKLVLRKIQ